jgi:hypothetical protein
MSIINISNANANAEALIEMSTGRMILSGINSLPAVVSTQ